MAGVDLAKPKGRKRQIEPREDFRDELNDRKRSKCDCYERCFNIKSVKAWANLILECECSCNIECMSKCSKECMLKCNEECKGNKQWIGGQNKIVLTHNNHIVGNRDITMMEQSEHKNSIMLRNLTEADWNSTFTCSFGTLFKSISLDGYNEQSAQASHTINTATESGAPNDTTFTASDAPNVTTAIPFGPDIESAQASHTFTTATVAGAPNDMTFTASDAPNVTTAIPFDQDIGSSVQIKINIIDADKLILVMDEQKSHTHQHFL
ncbi:uncharacterized protein LOC127699812 isoform X2 [Mytilus californianus]|uniref:uncharacterized protein LOC127699812 isoform X2 n=1 Tax=Mytilus californianus TaxID=6549 RepID=UPI00224611E3|nr:uncharacterized protein LOC127699812 isoform X2 [Mytilus californianus]